MYIYYDVKRQVNSRLLPERTALKNKTTIREISATLECPQLRDGIILLPQEIPFSFLVCSRTSWAVYYLWFDSSCSVLKTGRKTFDALNFNFKTMLELLRTVVFWYDWKFNLFLSNWSSWGILFKNLKLDNWLTLTVLHFVWGWHRNFEKVS